MVQPRLSARARAALVADVLLFAAAVPLILVDPRLGWYVFLGAMLLPVVALFAVLVARIVGRTRWYRNGLAVLLVFTGISAIVCVGSLLVWYPFLPLQWSLDEVPLAFSIPMLAGFYGFAFGILALVGLGMVASWRAHQRTRVLVGIPILAAIGLLMAGVWLLLAS